MKRFAILVATSLLAVFLTACGEHKKEEAASAPTEATQAAAPAETQAQPAEAPAAEEQH